jgi:hypothetical protein
MFRSLIKFSFFVVLITGAVLTASAQVDASNSGFGRERPIDPPKGFKEMVAKQRLEKARKEHEEMISRAEKALTISEQLEASFSKNNQLSRADLEKLEELEDIVDKIRDELGGDDDDREGEALRNENPTSDRDAFKFLKSSTVKLVDELKKTTRYSISVVAIQSSNAVLKMVRFLRLQR